MRNLSELHQCTLWRAGKLAAKKMLGPPKPPCKSDTSFLPVSAATLPAELHPWFTAPADALPGDRERIFGMAGTQVFRDSIARGSKRPYRMPLLSQPVMEACLRAPSWMWFTGGRNRAIARDAFRDILPPKVLHRRSKGTFTSYSGAIYGRNKHSMQTFLLNGELEARGMLDRDAVHRFFESALPPRDKPLMRIFDLCMIENWVRHHA